MARKRMSFDEARTAVEARINAAGGTLSHNELVEQLDAEGNGDAVLHFYALSSQGAIKPQVIAQSEGSPVLQYTLNAGGE